LLGTGQLSNDKDNALSFAGSVFALIRYQVVTSGIVLALAALNP
jgi:hypothetical protein